MTDLNNSILGAFLGVNLFSNVEDSYSSEAIDGFTEELGQGETDEVDPGAFFLLFASMLPQPLDATKAELSLEPLIQDSQPASVESDKLVAILPEDEGADQCMQTMNKLDDNIAMTWLNSSYYVPETSQKLNTQEHDIPLMETISEELSNTLSEEEEVELVKALSYDVKSDTPDTERLQPIEADSMEFFDGADTLERPSHVELPVYTKNFTEKAVLAVQYEPESETVSYSKEKFPGNYMLQDNTFIQDVPVIETQEFLERDQNMESLFHYTVATESTDAVMASEPLKSQQLDKEEVPVVTLQTSFSNSGEVVMSKRMVDFSLPLNLNIPVDTNNSEWSSQFSNHILWMGQQGIKSALIKINPEDLGPLEINVNVVKGTTSLTIFSHDQGVRDLIDQSLPKLQEMMAEQGLNLSEVQIDSERDSRQFARQNNQSAEQMALESEEEAFATPLTQPKQSQGLIDYFA